jgi:hypothetical protein
MLDDWTRRSSSIAIDEGTKETYRSRSTDFR